MGFRCHLLGFCYRRIHDVGELMTNQDLADLCIIVGGTCLLTFGLIRLYNKQFEGTEFDIFGDVPYCHGVTNKEEV